MGDILLHYERVNPTSWAYLASLLSIALFFKFNRIFCMRNLDLLLLVLLAPGLLCIEHAVRGEASELTERIGYIWLFSVNALLLLRMLLDSSMVRRPMLEPNLLTGGLTFLMLSLLAFLTANVITGKPSETDLYAVQRAEHLSHREASDLELDTLDTHGPGFSFLFLMPHISTRAIIADADLSDSSAEVVENAISVGNSVTAKVMAILCQFFIVLAILLISHRHFDNTPLGIAAATLYLLLPYTALWTGNVTHSLPAALILWAVLLYRYPFLSGILIGLGCGAIYYPFALLPLWLAYYWKRGVMRFSVGVALTLLLLVLTLVFTSTDIAMFFGRLQQMFGLRLPAMDRLSGVWEFWNGWYRVPILAAFAGLSISYAMWPVQKNLATLMSGSAALMLGVQFWHAHSGGLALAWYLPLFLLIVFRPNLEDRIATAMVAPSRWDKPQVAK